MLITETVTINNKEFIHNYSDESFYIQKDGTNELYEDAYDLPETGYEYTETEKKIDKINILSEIIRQQEEQEEKPKA